jgi:demethylmenaquinone methyltransferase/2-methoxy-6-polyprenyl-1,4-benzoquinol methylase
MSHLNGVARARFVRQMFARIARRYDLLNRLMTLGQDLRWRREAIDRLSVQEQSVLLDLGTGTGDLALELARRFPTAIVIACDFTPEMLEIARSRDEGGEVCWVIADANYLPFPAETFEGVVSGFLLRNLPAVEAVLGEEFRVLRLGGRVVSLDTTPPRGLLRPLLNVYLRVVIPLLGWLFAGDVAAYRYLPLSTEAFLAAEQLAERMREAGFGQVAFVRRMLGTVAIHWGSKGEV